MPVQPTSRAAYDELQLTLSQRQTKVLGGLATYYMTHRHQWPTAYELYRAMKADGLVNDLNDVRPRLTELKEKGRVENPTVKRHCAVTRKRAFVWRLTDAPRLF
jgi:Fe2+ or Zn2+ uptake regulation protein